jgi:hypothetical protein
MKKKLGMQCALVLLSPPPVLIWSLPITSVADVYPGSCIQGQKDSGSWIRTRKKNLSIFHSKTVSRLSEK